MRCGSISRRVWEACREGDAIGKSAVHLRLLVLTILAGMSVDSCRAQDLAPRAYVITPLHSNDITLTLGFYAGASHKEDAGISLG
jgi:hypothetical protein